MALYDALTEEEKRRENEGTPEAQTPEGSPVSGGESAPEPPEAPGDARPPRMGDAQKQRLTPPSMRNSGETSGQYYGTPGVGVEGEEVTVTARKRGSGTVYPAVESGQNPDGYRREEFSWAVEERKKREEKERKKDEKERKKNKNKPSPEVRPKDPDNPGGDLEGDGQRVWLAGTDKDGRKLKMWIPEEHAHAFKRYGVTEISEDDPAFNDYTTMIADYKIKGRGEDGRLVSFYWSDASGTDPRTGDRYAVNSYPEDHEVGDEYEEPKGIRRKRIPPAGDMLEGAPPTEEASETKYQKSDTKREEATEEKPTEDGAYGGDAMYGEGEETEETAETSEEEPTGETPETELTAEMPADTGEEGDTEIGEPETGRNTIWLVGDDEDGGKFKMEVPVMQAKLMIDSYGMRTPGKEDNLDEIEEVPWNDPTQSGDDGDTAEDARNYLQGESRLPQPPSPLTDEWRNANDEVISGMDRMLLQLEDELGKYTRETAGQRKRRERREKAAMIVAAVTDGLQALSNLYFTTQYAPSMNLTDDMLQTKQLGKWYDKLEKARKENDAARAKLIERISKLQLDRGKMQSAALKIEMEMLNKSYELKLKAVDAEEKQKKNALYLLKVTGQLAQQEYDNELKKIKAETAREEARLKQEKAKEEIELLKERKKTEQARQKNLDKRTQVAGQKKSGGGGKKSGGGSKSKGTEDTRIRKKAKSKGINLYNPDGTAKSTAQLKNKLIEEGETW